MSTFQKSFHVNFPRMLLWGLPFLVFLIFSLIISCDTDSGKPVSEAHPTGFLNLHDSVKYVGMSTCRQCHSGIHETFSHTGMGQSFEKASKRKSAGNFDHHKPVYDTRFDYYYYPYWAGEDMMLREFRLAGKDTVHKREQKLDYIIGSGQHTNSHLYSSAGYIFQAPITWYSQEKKWGLPPGFDEGAVTRFSRIISLECMSCHNAYPDFVEGSENRFRSVLQGIDCERCHGPGSLHVQEKMAGKIIDTSKYTDYTIVNPRKLPVDLQMEICQRCHLQGNSVLKPGKTFFDFRPGMRLTEVFDVFLPKYEGDQSSFIMASHVERLKMSKCYIHSSGQLNCITCHNPHISVKVTGTQIFNRACSGCHNSAEKNLCTESPVRRKVVKDNCVECHMPSSGTVDIPHVTTHDHYIRKPVKKGTMPGAREFAGLICLTDPSPGDITRAKAYLNYFEKFDARRTHLDSAKYYLDRSTDSEEYVQTKVQYYFLSQDFDALVKMAPEAESSAICKKDGWAMYRVGEAYQKSGMDAGAEKFYGYAVDVMPHSPEFRNKLAGTQIRMKKYAEAEKVLNSILTDLSDYVPALNNLGYLYVLKKDHARAKTLLEKALLLDPDYELALANLASWHLSQNDKTQARKYAQYLMQKYPGNPEYLKLYRASH